MGERIERNNIWPPPHARWIVRVFGRIDISSQLGEKPHFRSKSVNSLFSYLVLHPGIEISRFILEETIWPESDCGRQAQNLRRAIADLRDALEGGIERGSLIQTKRDVVRLNSDLLASDTQRYTELIDLGFEKGHEDSLSEIVSIYGGPLLAPLSDEWIYPYRLEFEELFAQSVAKLCQIKIATGSPKDAIRIGRAALLSAPNREDIHIALIQGYRVAGLEAEAIRQFEDLERMMDEEWGEQPSAQAKAALESEAITYSQRPPVTPVKEQEPAGGAMTLSSRYYIQRPGDDQVKDCLDRRETVILIQGSRQTGKSSMLARTLEYARNCGVLAVHNDFQTIGESQLSDEELLYKTLAHSLCTQLKIDIDISQSWTKWLGPNMNLDAIMGRLLAEVDGPVCWAIDEADRLFGRPYANDFFGLLRSWHNRRALDPEGPWNKLTLVLSYAMEAHLFITDLNQSPFNIGFRVSLRDFSKEEVSLLAERFGISDPKTIEAVHCSTNGHPFLTRRAFAFMSQGGNQLELISSVTLQDGPFSDHLQAVLGVVLQDEELVAEVKRMLAGKKFARITTQYKLMAVGILAVRQDLVSEFRVPAYGHYLKLALS